MEADDENMFKWPSIGLTIRKFNWLVKDNELREKNPNKPKNYQWINDMIFKNEVFATVKYDGTNVGIDTNGLMYGRRKCIPKTSKSYQKTKLDFVQKIESNLVLDSICKLSNIDSEIIEKFQVYGELICNNLFSYHDENLNGTFQVFGAIIKPCSLEACDVICDKLDQAGFAFMVREENSDEEEEEEEGLDSDNMGDADDCKFNKQISIVMNQTYFDILKKLKYPTVKVAEGVGMCFCDFVDKNYEWMIGGQGEGLILVLPDNGKDSIITKWKIGAEANSSNNTTLEKILFLQEDDKEKEIFGQNTEKAIDFFKKLENIQKSSMKIEPVIIKPEPKKKLGDNKVELNEEINMKYEEPVKSAKSKFDHGDTYFAKGGKGLNEYIGLLSKECLNDIVIEKEDKKGMKQHNDILMLIIKPEFIEFNKNKNKK